MKTLQLSLLFFFCTTTIHLQAQEKIKFAFGGSEKLEFKTNGIGDLLMNYLSSGTGSDNLFIGQNTGQNI